MSIWLFRLKKFMVEREVLLGLVIFGFCAMVADLFVDFNHRYIGGIVRGMGLAFLLFILIFEFGLKNKRQSYEVPIMFTEEEERTKNRNMFTNALKNANLYSNAKVLEELTQLKLYDLIILLRPNPRKSFNSQEWVYAWNELIHRWNGVDRESMEEPFTSEDRCYHIFFKIPLALVFALGASVKFQRQLVLHHIQHENIYCVMDLKNPHDILEGDGFSVDPPEIIPEGFNTLPKNKKLILHVIISKNHVEKFQAHPDYNNVDSVALIYRDVLDPNTDWLPYVQQIFRNANPLIAQYQEVDICLNCPSPIIFALGMAFSRMPHITVYHLFEDDKYRLVFRLSEIERRLFFS